MTDKPDYSQSPDQIINQLTTSWTAEFFGINWYDVGNTIGIVPDTYSWNRTNVTYAFPDFTYSQFNLNDNSNEIITVPTTDQERTFAREAFEMCDDLIAINLTQSTS